MSDSDTEDNRDLYDRDDSDTDSVDSNISYYENPNINAPDIKLSDKRKKILRKKLENIIIKKETKNLKLLANKCSEIHKYVNLDLNINLIGSSQNHSKEQTIFDQCAKMIVDENVKLYITFNEYNYYNNTQMEYDAFKKFCNDADCKYVSIPVKDWQPPTPMQLVEL